MPVFMKLTVRLPLSIHSALTRSSKETGKSLNAEVVDRLNQSFGGVYLRESAIEDDNIIKKISDLEARIAELEAWKQLQTTKS